MIKLNKKPTHFHTFLNIHKNTTHTRSQFAYSGRQNCLKVFKNGVLRFEIQITDDDEILIFFLYVEMMSFGLRSIQGLSEP